MDRLSRKQLKEILDTLTKNKEGLQAKQARASNEDENDERKLIDADLNRDNVKNDDLKKRKESPEWLSRLKQIRHRYTSSFTMHALDHIINGTLPEKVFWTVKLFIVLGTAIFMCRNLFVSFFKNKVISKLTYTPKTEMNLPMVFICGNNMEVSRRTFQFQARNFT